MKHLESFILPVKYPAIYSSINSSMHSGIHPSMSASTPFRNIFRKHMWTWNQMKSAQLQANISLEGGKEKKAQRVSQEKRWF